MEGCTRCSGFIGAHVLFRIPGRPTIVLVYSSCLLVFIAFALTVNTDEYIKDTLLDDKLTNDSANRGSFSVHTV